MRSRAGVDPEPNEGDEAITRDDARLEIELVLLVPAPLVEQAHPRLAARERDGGDARLVDDGNEARVVLHDREPPAERRDAGGRAHEGRTILGGVGTLAVEQRAPGRDAERQGRIEDGVHHGGRA